MATADSPRTEVRKPKVVIFHSGRRDLTSKSNPEGNGSIRTEVQMIEDAFKDVAGEVDKQNLDLKRLELALKDKATELEQSMEKFDYIIIIIIIIIINKSRRLSVRKTITQHFVQKDFKKLRTIPKLFLIDVSEEKEEQDVVRAASSSEEKAASNEPPYDSDMLVAYYIGENGGGPSPFITSLCENFNTRDLYRTFHELMIGINDELQKKNGRLLRFYSTLRHEIRLPRCDRESLGPMQSNITSIKKPKVVIIMRYKHRYIDDDTHGALPGYGKDKTRLLKLFKTRMEITVNTENEASEPTETDDYDDVVMEREVEPEDKSIEELIRKEYESMRNGEDCFICIIMSHGNEGIVEDPKLGQSVNIRKLIAAATDSENPRSREIPKLFFIQTCQGETGETVNVRPAAPGDQRYPYLEDKNILLGLAATDDYVSWVHPEEGSAYLQSLCQVLGDSQTNSLISMMVRANEKVAGCVFKGPVGGVQDIHHVEAEGVSAHKKYTKQMSVFESSLTKDFFFDWKADFSVHAGGDRVTEEEDLNPPK